MLTSTLGNTVGKILLADVAVAICVATLAIQTAATRMAFSMSRDRALPFSRQLGAVSPETGTPVLPAIVIGLLAVAILGINVGDAGLFAALASVEVSVIYIAYLLVTIPTLVRRVQGWTPEQGSGLYSLGRWGLPVNIVAVVWGVLMMVNIAWPRASVYDPAGGHWYLHYFSPLFIAGMLVVGGLAWRKQLLASEPSVPAEVAVPSFAE